MDWKRSASTDVCQISGYKTRKIALLAFMLGGMALLFGRAIHLQVLDKKFLQDQGYRRQVGVVNVSAYRGKIQDRNAEPLAISTPVQTIWVNPQLCSQAQQGKSRKSAKLRKECLKYSDGTLRKMAAILHLNITKARQQVNPASGKRFVFIKRRVSPPVAAKVKALQLPGIYFEREFKRYYPAAEITAQLLGFTDIDDVGQEGLELLYEEHLKGVPGSKRVIRDGKRRVIADIENIKEPVAGQDLTLSIDQRLQYLAYRELKKAVMKHQAVSGSLVILDAKNGEVLAAVNQPSFNPNSRSELQGKHYRNRAITDVFEPGSTVKPFVVAAALDGGYINENINIKTHGFFRVGRNLVRDIHNYGTLSLTRVLKKSSNVAASKIALTMPPKYFWRFYHKLGFGEYPGVGFPGESSGSLLDYQRWNDFAQATLSFGYGLSTSVLQLARAYTALADDGVLHSVSLLQRAVDPEARKVISTATARKVRAMLETVVEKDGTAYRARVNGFRVAGKTGTVKKASVGGYSKNKYQAIFVGMAPASDPRLVIAVMVDEPRAEGYYGGIVAGPVFSRVMGGALRVLGVAPDHPESMPFLLVKR